MVAPDATTASPRAALAGRAPRRGLPPTEAGCRCEPSGCGLLGALVGCGLLSAARRIGPYMGVGQGQRRGPKAQVGFRRGVAHDGKQEVER